MLVRYSRLLLDATNRLDSCHKSGQIWPKFWPDPDLAGFAKNGQMPDPPEPKSGTSLVATNHSTLNSDEMRSAEMRSVEVK